MTILFYLVLVLSLWGMLWQSRILTAVSDRLQRQPVMYLAAGFTLMAVLVPLALLGSTSTWLAPAALVLGGVLLLLMTAGLGLGAQGIGKLVLGEQTSPVWAFGLGLALLALTLLYPPLALLLWLLVGTTGMGALLPLLIQPSR